MSDVRKLFHNTILLTVASFLMRTVSVSFNVYLTNRIGADGIGLFQLIFAVYSLAITFACSGVRLGSMRLIADENALGKRSDRQIMQKCLLYALICSAATAAVLFFGADFIGTKWIKDARSISSLKILCASLPFVAMSASLNGYFTSVGKLVRYTAVQLLEQIFKITVTVIVLKRIITGNLEASCKAVTFGISAAEIFSLACSYTVYRFSSEKSEHSETSIIKKLLKISVPDAVGSEMRSILMTVEHLLIPSGLRKSGAEPQAALASYGVIHGMSLPLVLYPSALLSSLSGLMIPELSAHHISGSKTRISYIISRVLHMTLVFSIGTAGIMYFNAERLSQAVYGNTDASFYIQILSPLIPIMYADMSVDGILKGLDQQMSCMRYNIIDASLCVILVYFLVPVFAVKGYIIVVFVSECVNFFLSFRRLTVVSEVKVELFKDLVIPLLCVMSAGMFKRIVFGLLSFNLNAKASAASEIIFSVLCYCTLLVVFRSIDNEEVLWIKRIIKPSKT